MAFIGFFAQLILIVVLINAASNRPDSTAGQRWGIGIAVVVLSKAIGFGLGLATLAALPAFGVTIDERDIEAVSLLADIVIGIIVIIGGYFIAQALYNRVCGPKVTDSPTPISPTADGE